jgi:site-specific DNA-cytosine methylase
VIDSEGISYAVTNGEKDGVPKIVEPQFLEFSNFISLGAQNNSYNRVWKTEGYCGALNCTKQMEILEPQIGAMRGRNPDNPSERGRSNGRYKQRLEMNENGTSNTLTGVQKDNLVVEPRYRIRKLTPRECFRLMDVDDADIDKIQEAGISNSQQYKMAGNSIVVACLYHLFRKMFTETQNEERQLTFW